ncbi:hypothetical protein BST61_g5567 [Cercospora zeina]
MSLHESNGGASESEAIQLRSADGAMEVGTEGREELHSVEVIADSSSVRSAPHATTPDNGHNSTGDNGDVDPSTGHQEGQAPSRQVTEGSESGDTPTPAIPISAQDAFIAQTTDFDVPALREPPPAYRFRASADEIVGSPPAYQLPPVYQREEVRGSGRAPRGRRAALNNSAIPVHHDATANRSFPFPAARVRNGSMEGERMLLPAFFDGHDYDSFGDEESLGSGSSVAGENLAIRMRKALSWSSLLSPLRSLGLSLRCLASTLRHMDRESLKAVIAMAIVAITIVVSLFLVLLIFWRKFDPATSQWRSPF